LRNQKFNTHNISGRVLVLNQSYLPLTITTTKKAVILLFLDKAEVVEINKEKVIRTIKDGFPYPSVIRLKKFAKLANRKIDLTRKNVMKRDGMQCQYCGKKHVNLTVDHILPKSRGGKDEWENLTTACNECNNKKGNRTPEEAGMRLLSIPKKPNPLFFIRNNLNASEILWKDYLFY